MAKTFLQRFAECFAELRSTEDVMLVVIRGHLYCESAVGDLLRNPLKYPDEIQIDRLGYRAKVNLCTALGVFGLDLKPGLTQLGQLRNKYVHQLDYEATEKDQADLVNSVKSTIGLPAQYYLRRLTEFPNGFRRCVIALWLPLAMYCAPREEANGMSEKVQELMAAVCGLSDDEFRRRCRTDVEKFFEQRGEQMPSNHWSNVDSRQEPRDG